MNALLTSPKKLGRLLLLMILATLVLATFEHAWARFQARVTEPGRGADWIWAAGVDAGKQHRKPQPVAFYATRDFDLQTVPKTAWLEIVADDSYALYLNGYWLGANSYQPRAAADFYTVTDFLRVGINRITIELRSARGIGALLTTLRTGEPDHALLRSGPGWKILHRFVPALFDPDQLLTTGEEPQIWGTYPTGRWRVAPAQERALPQTPSAALRVRNTNPKGRWADLRVKRRRFPGLGPLLIFDWGETVTGHLTLNLEPTSDPGLLYCGLEVPDPERDPVSLIVHPIADAPWWTSSTALKFRYCLSVGLPMAAAPQVEPAKLSPTAPEPSGVWGLEPPDRPAPDPSMVVWQRVHEEQRQARERRAKERG